MVLAGQASLADGVGDAYLMLVELLLIGTAIAQI